MKQSFNRILRAIDAVLREKVGWSVVIALTTLVGIWVGMAFTSPKVATPWMVIQFLPVLAVACLFTPPLWPAVITTALAWYLPMKIDSGWLRFAAVCVNVGGWVGSLVWTSRLWSL